MTLNLSENPFDSWLTPESRARIAEQREQLKQQKIATIILALAEGYQTAKTIPIPEMAQGFWQASVRLALDSINKIPGYEKIRFIEIGPGVVISNEGIPTENPNEQETLTYATLQRIFSEAS